MGRISTGLKIGGALAVLAPLKYAVYHRLKTKYDARQKLKRGGVRFNTLSRQRQGQMIYYRRSQLRDYENVYKRGARPRLKKLGSD